MRACSSFIVSKQILPLLAFSVFIVSGNVARADDWGYEQPPAPKKIEEQSAASMVKTLIPKANPKTAAPVKTAPAKANPVKAAPAKSTPARANQPSGLSREIKGDKDPKAAAPDVFSTVEREKTEDTTAAPHTVPGRAQPFAGIRGSGASSIDAIVDKDQQAARCWVQLFQTVSKEKMDYSQQKQMEAYIVGKAHKGEKETQEIRSILKFWPKLINDLKDKPDMEMHYADLFKALLRLHERTSTEATEVPNSPFHSDADLIGQLLGLQRLAVAGDPSFSEDAVNAYADMAVFIYEQQHAGRTIDAADNRTLFAKVVVEKFNRAPTPADQRAMASFDLAWSKFKIIWFSSSSSTQKVLLDKLVNSGANSSLSVVKDPLLDTVLANWPWTTKP